VNPFQAHGVRLHWSTVDAIEIGYQFHQLRDCFSLQVKLLTHLLYLSFKLFWAHCEASIGPFYLAQTKNQVAIACGMAESDGRVPEPSSSKCLEICRRQPTNGKRDDDSHRSMKATVCMTVAIDS
jgi:hypothetical protein